MKNQVLREAIIREFLLQSLDEVFPDIVNLVVPVLNVRVASVSDVGHRMEAYASNSSRSAWLAFLPTGLTLIIPVRNSINVPRFFGSLISDR